jgi:hypothetical protein
MSVIRRETRLPQSVQLEPVETVACGEKHLGANRVGRRTELNGSCACTDYRLPVLQPLQPKPVIN